ncbi:MAG: DUF3124 domain-containing protein [Anaerolineae bacterium]
MNTRISLSVRAALCVVLLMTAMLASGCSEASTQSPSTPPTLSANDVAVLHIVTGQTVFVPAYSEIFYGGEGQLLELTTTLAIHNTDLEHEIIVRSVRYYDTDGTLVREYIESPLALSPMATTGFVVEAQNTSGGWGANFMVEWGAEAPVYQPVIEAVMISNRGTEGVSFISEGRVVSEQVP